MQLRLNQVPITFEYGNPTEWEPHVLQHKIAEKMLGTEVDDIKLHRF